MVEKDAKFWDRLAEKYSKHPIGDEAAYERKLEISREYFTPQSQVLEIGCGTGSTAILHAPYVKSILATDISKNMIAIAQRKASLAGVENIEFMQSSLLALEPRREAYDVVMAMSLLHLLADPAAAIEKCKLMLKHGGVFISSTSCLGDTHRFLKYIGPMGRWLGFLPQINVFTEARLKEMLDDSGLKVEHFWKPGPKKAVFVVARKVG